MEEERKKRRQLVRDQKKAERARRVRERGDSPTPPSDLSDEDWSSDAVSEAVPLAEESSHSEALPEALVIMDPPGVHLVPSQAPSPPPADVREVEPRGPEVAAAAVSTSRSAVTASVTVPPPAVAASAPAPTSTAVALAASPPVGAADVAALSGGSPAMALPVGATDSVAQPAGDVPRPSPSPGAAGASSSPAAGSGLPAPTTSPGGSGGVRVPPGGRSVATEGR